MMVLCLLVNVMNVLKLIIYKIKLVYKEQLLLIIVLLIKIMIKYVRNVNQIIIHQ